MKNEIIIKQTIIDKGISYIAPTWGAKRLKSRLMLAVGGSYIGASKKRRQLENFLPKGGDADADTLGDIPLLRERSRDLLRNTPIATGAIGTNCTHVVGPGLKVQSRIDRRKLGMEEEEAEEWQQNTEREFNSWAESLDCDIARGHNFYDLQNLVLRSTLESGDVFVLMPFKMLNTSHYGLKLQTVEADRVTNKDSVRDTNELTAGIEKEKDGTPVNYHIQTIHPGTDKGYVQPKWIKIPAFTQSGRRNVIHVYEKLRPGQTRGVPYLAPVIEHLHQLGKYTTSELMAAVVSSMFTVFIKTETGNVGFSSFEPTAEAGGASTDKDYKMGHGAIVELANNEEVQFANPGRPNTSFDVFVQAILRQIGVALGLPFELLVMHFTKSYSAARSAMLNAWKMFNARREWLANHFCNIVYEAWMEEAVLRGRVIAPGFLNDPVIKRAYLKNIWIGTPPGQIDPTKEIAAAEKRLGLKVSTLSEETAQLTGTDFDAKIDRLKKEKKILKELGSNNSNTQTNANNTNDNIDPDDEGEGEGEGQGEGIDE